jgi:ATP-dependent DNA ligase
MKPMLLQKWYPGALRFPIWAEQKVNGVRCCVVVSETEARALSREGNALRAGQYLADQIAGAAGPGVYDGELDAGTFRRTLSAVKRGAGLNLAFRAWDCLTLDEWRAGRSCVALEARRARLEALRDVPGVELVRAVLIHDPQELDREFRAAVGRGWEGVVLKRPGSVYTCGARGPSWWKMKPGEGAP